MMIRQGYGTTGQWVLERYDDKEKDPVWSTSLSGFVLTRVLLYQERHCWRAVVSVRVGKNGELPVCTGLIKRKKSRFIPPFKKMEEKIALAVGRTYRWATEPANVYSAQAVARLVEVFIKKKNYRKARIINAFTINGTINAATVAEALSMVQSMVAKSREDRLDSALIWGEVYR
jgi:hypothetical protein